MTVKDLVQFCEAAKASISIRSDGVSIITEQPKLIVTSRRRHELEEAVNAHAQKVLQ